MTITNNAAYEIPDFALGVIEANVDMSSESTWQFTAVKVVPASGAGLLGPAALAAPTAGGPILGILQNNPVLSEAGEVVCSGVSKAKAGGSFNPGDLLMTTGAGLLILATSGFHAVAQALQVGASGSVVSVLVKEFGVVP